MVIGTNIGAEKVLSVDSCRNIGEYGLNIPLNGVLPLLIWCGAFMSAMMLLVKLVGFIIGPEGGIILVPAEDTCFESACGEEASTRSR